MGFFNQSITSTTDYGMQLTTGFSQTPWTWYESFRYQKPELNASLLASYDTHYSNDWISFQYEFKVHYFQHASSNGATSLTSSYGISLQTPSDHFWTRLKGNLGLQALGCWSTYYDATLWGLSPHLRLNLVQSFDDKAFISLFISTDTLTLEQSQLSYFYGASLAVKVSDSFLMKIEPMVRLSDIYSESFFITMQDFSISVIWFDKSKKDLLASTLGEML
jgi:hypothetical protein